MKPDHRFAGFPSLLASAIVCTLSFLNIAEGQGTPQGKAGNNAVPPMVEQMAGTWNVQQRMWAGPGAKATELPPAVARRRLVAGAFLEETMELAPGSRQEPFTRIAYFNYNAVNQQYEYFSMDTRAPQMMNEKSHKTGVQGKAGNQREMPLYGGTFVAPQWGDMKNVAFKYRLGVGDVEKDRQVVRLYLTPQSGKSSKEFLAFEYVYTRQH